MHWTRVTLLGLFATVIASSQPASAQVTDDSGVVRLDDFSGSMSLSQDGGTYFSFDRMSGDGVGFRNSYTRLGLRAKLFEFDESHFFTELTGLITDQSRLGANLGGGFRTMIDGGVAGIHAWYDSYETQNGNTYSQGVIGAEYLHRWLDLRINGYMADDKENFIRLLDPGTTPVFFGNNFGTVGTAQVERSLSGFDFEGGVPLPVAEFIRVFGGTYFLTGGGDDTWGTRGRVEARVGEGTILSFMVSDDERFGTNLNFNIQLMLGPGISTTRFVRDTSGWARRYDPVRRAQTVQVAQDRSNVNVELINAETGNPFHITWVDNTSTAPGNGTFENPFTNLPNSSPDASHILVRRGVGATTGNISLVDNQNLWGEGREYVLNTTRLGAVVIPDQYFDQTGPAPTLQAANGALPLVTLANNNQVINFNMLGGNFAIRGNDINRFHIESVNASATNGLVITNADGVGRILDSSFTASGAGTAAFVSNTGGGRLDLIIDDLATSGGAEGLHLYSENAQLLTTMNNVVANNHTGSGIILSQFNGLLFANVNDAHVQSTGGLTGNGFDLRSSNGGQLIATMDNVSARGNGDLFLASTNNATLNTSVVNSDFSNSTAGSGVVLNASGSTSQFHFENLIANNNAEDGFRIAAAVGSLVNASVIDSTLTGNQDDSFDITAVTDADITLFVDPTNASGAVTGSGLEFFVAGLGSSLNATFLDTDLSSAGDHVISGIVDNQGFARVNLFNVDASDAGVDGLNVAVSNGSTFQSQAQNTTFSGSANNGISLDVINGSNAALNFDNVEATNNGNTGFAFNVATGGLGSSSLNATVANSDFSDNPNSNITGTSLGGGSVATLNFNNVVADNQAANGGVNLAVAGGGRINANWSGAASSISNTDAAGVLLTVLNPASVINFDFADGDINGNAGHGIDALEIAGGAGTQLNVRLNNASVSGNGGSGLTHTLTSAGATGVILLDDSQLSGNALDGLEFNVSGGAALLVNGDDSAFSNNDERGIHGTVDGLGSLALLNLTGATALNSNDQGVMLTASNDGVIDATLNAAIITGSGRENILAIAESGGELALSASGSNFSQGGQTVASDNVRVESTGAGSVAVVDFNSVAMNGASGHGLHLLADASGSLLAELSGTTSANNNAGAGLRIFGDGADSVVVLGSGPNTFNNNGQNGVDAQLTNLPVGVVAVSGSFNNNIGNGVNVLMDNVATGAVSVQGPGTVNNNTAEGVDINVANSTLADVVINGTFVPALGINNLTVAGNGGNAIDVNLDNTIVTGTADIGGNTVAGHSNAVVVDLANNTDANVDIHDNTITGAAQNGIRVTADSGNHTIVIDSNVVTASGQHNIALELSGGAIADQLHIDGNTATGSLAGNGVDVLITDSAAVTTGSFDGNDVSDNLAGSGLNVLVESSGSLTLASTVGNVANGNALSGLNFNLTDTASLELQDVSGNTVNGNGRVGMLLTAVDNTQFDVTLGASGLVVGNNVFNGNADAGLGIQMSDNSLGTLAVSDSVFSNTTNGGLANFNGEGVSIRLIDFARLQNTSFDFVNVTGNTASGLAFFNDGFSEITTVSITNSLFTNNGFLQGTGGNGGLPNDGHGGISVIRQGDGVIDNVLIDNNTITGNANGVYVVARNANFTDEYVITNNTITGQTFRGIALRAEADADITAQIENNIVSNNGTQGIQTTERRNSAGDSLNVDMTILNNLVQNNGAQGIQINAAHNLVTIGAVGAFPNNTISGNGAEGIQINNLGSETITNNLIQGNGGAAGIDLNGTGNFTTISQNRIVNNTADGIEMSALGAGSFFIATVANNYIAGNGQDGVEIVANSAGAFIFTPTATLTNNQIEDNTGRGVAIFNRGNGTDQTMILNATVNNNLIQRNGEEGIYVVNTASQAQDTDVQSTVAMDATGSVFADPRMNLQINGNTILDNGALVGFPATGLVIRVGTSDASTSFTDPGGFANNRGGIVANVTGNGFGGNFGSDVWVESFVSTVPPNITGGDWNDGNQDPRDDTDNVFGPGGYQSDPLARLDLTFLNNFGEEWQMTNAGAFYNNDEPVFKSRTQGQDGTDPFGPGYGPGVIDDDGPFASGTRQRNAQRQASRTGFPPFMVDNTAQATFLYPGMGASTFRVNQAGNAFGSGTGFGTVINGGGGAAPWFVDFQSYTWGALP
ncbi:MAG: right-handed parallel beta-helix repeat-containing protein [Planctomyces sp.]|nr:right-handed parallel beta-helix repeat-containing protein [Planctomyces sp.]